MSDDTKPIMPEEYDNMDVIAHTEGYWDKNNPIVPKDTIAYSIDNDKTIRVGDGVTKWKDINPFSFKSEEGINLSPDLDNPSPNDAVSAELFNEKTKELYDKILEIMVTPTNNIPQELESSGNPGVSPHFSRDDHVHKIPDIVPHALLSDNADHATFSDRATSASKLATARTITIPANMIAGNATISATFDGSSNISFGGGCSNNCSGGCSGCTGTCAGGCGGGCTGSCVSSCTGTCTGSCTGACADCKGTCQGTCLTTCTASCSHSCKYDNSCSCSGK